MLVLVLIILVVVGIILSISGDDKDPDQLTQEERLQIIQDKKTTALREQQLKEVRDFEYMLSRAPIEIEKYNRDDRVYGGDILREWNYQYSGGSLLDGSQKRNSNEIILNPL